MKKIKLKVSLGTGYSGASHHDELELEFEDGRS